MNYTYTMTGGLSVRGCAHFEATKAYTFKYAPGSVLYTCFEAEKGILEEIVIKKIRLIQNRKTNMKMVPFYYDKNNSVYMENELCSRSSAISLAIAYYENQLEAINELLANCIIS